MGNSFLKATENDFVPPGLVTSTRCNPFPREAKKPTKSSTGRRCTWRRSKGVTCAGTKWTVSSRVLMWLHGTSSLDHFHDRKTPSKSPQAAADGPSHITHFLRRENHLTGKRASDDVLPRSLFDSGSKDGWPAVVKLEVTVGRPRHDSLAGSQLSQLLPAAATLTPAAAAHARCCCSRCC